MRPPQRPLGLPAQGKEVQGVAAADLGCFCATFQLLQGKGTDRFQLTVTNVFLGPYCRGRVTVWPER